MNALVLVEMVPVVESFRRGVAPNEDGPDAIARLRRNEDARKMMGSCRVAELRGHRCKESPICVICFCGNTSVPYFMR